LDTERRDYFRAVFCLANTTSSRRDHLDFLKGRFGLAVCDVMTTLTLARLVCQLHKRRCETRRLSGNSILDTIIIAYQHVLQGNGISTHFVLLQLMLACNQDAGEHRFVLMLLELGLRI
jgi:hypothetical protein